MLVVSAVRCVKANDNRNRRDPKGNSIVTIKSEIKIWLFEIKQLPLHPQNQNGALDEWLSQRSAKPSTAVRIRQAPLSNGTSSEVPFFCCFENIIFSVIIFLIRIFYVPLPRI